MKKRPGAAALTVRLRGTIGIPIKLLLSAFVALLAGTIAGGRARRVTESVLEDPTSRAEDRVGAALALRATGADGAAERIRVAASTTANPRLRVALDATAEDALDDEMLDSVAEVESEAR